MARGKKTYELHKDEIVTIVRRTSNGRKDPAHIEVALTKEDAPQHWTRVLRLTVDELFDLTEALDDLCDDIEDGLVFGEQS